MYQVLSTRVVTGASPPPVINYNRGPECVPKCSVTVVYMFAIAFILIYPGGSALEVYI